MLYELKSLLKRVVSKLAAGAKPRQLPLCSTSYLISSAGSVWNKMTEEQAHAHGQLGAAEVGAVGGGLFEQVK